MIRAAEAAFVNAVEAELLAVEGTRAGFPALSADEIGLETKGGIHDR